MSSHEHHDGGQSGHGQTAATCYRHPDRPGVQCQRCDRLICPQCMTQASVGVHCPECVKGNKQKVYTQATLPGSQGLVTNALIALNVAAFVIQVIFYDARAASAGTSALELGLNGPRIDILGQWWRVFTSGFLHFGIFHLGMNMFSLYRIGPLLERTLGPRRYAISYVTMLVGGSFGALLLEPNALTMGASGAIFGLLGLLVMLFRSRGISLAQSGLRDVLIINAVISFSGFVSLGGHAGGFVAGIALGIMYWGMNPGDQPLFGRDQTKPDAATIAAGVALFIACLVIA